MRERVEVIVDKYRDALGTLVPDDFVNRETYYAVRTVWEEVLDDCERLLS